MNTQAKVPSSSAAVGLFASGCPTLRVPWLCHLINRTELAEMKQFALSLAGILLLASCSQSTGGMAATEPPVPELPPTLDPVGVYDYATELEGQPLSGTFTITGSPGAYGGSISSDMGIIPLRDIEVDGLELSFVGDLPDVTVFFTLSFEGDSFNGQWDAGGMVGSMSGTKR
jgi:hypothetical protein